MKQSFKVINFALSVWNDFRSSQRILVPVNVFYKFAETWLIVPVVAMGLAAVLTLAGHSAVSNWDAFTFLLSPMGFLYLAVVSTVTVVLLLFELASIMSLASLADTVARPTMSACLVAAFPRPWRVALLGAVILMLVVLACVPFVLLALLTYRSFLSQHDINYYLTERPTAFWLAVSSGILIFLFASIIEIMLLVRLSFALPVLIFENRSAFESLRISNERVHGASWRVGSSLLGWLFATILLGIAVEAGYRHFAGFVLDYAGDRPLFKIVLLLTVQAGLFAICSFVTVTGNGLITRRLYLIRNQELGLNRLDNESGLGRSKTFDWSLPLVTVPLLLLTPVVLWTRLAQVMADHPPVKVTAHRGHSRAAPENTMSAVREAIKSNADYAEVDVLLTADGVPVLLHDSDLKRVARDERKISDISIDEVQKLDVGSWFGSEFVGERVPTLEEVMKLSKGQIKLNIELKVYGPDSLLIPEVARLIRDLEFESECIVTTFDYDSLLEAKQLNPRLKTGLIVAHALGDVSKLDVDLFSVRANWLSDHVLRHAQRRGKEVHVWTVNNPAEMLSFMKRGVDNIITDDPDLLISVRNRWVNLSASERILLATRLLLGLNP